MTKPFDRRPLSVAALAAIAALATGCDGSGVSSEEDAKRAYQGLDASIDKAITLGFDGFNAASNANIPPQTAKGTKGGTMTIAGHVDQGSSSNKTMSLTEQLAKYSDDGKLTYDTEAGALPALDMKLAKVPTGTLEGTLAGKFALSGELSGSVTLNLTFAGDLQASAGDPDVVERKPGTTHITGTADSDFGTYEVDVTR